MKKFINKMDELRALDEMARIGVMDNYDFRIYSEPLGQPSIHVVSNDFEIVLYLKDLRVLEVKFNQKKSKYKFVKNELPQKDIIVAIKKLMKKDTSIGNSRVDYLLDSWNENNEKYQINKSHLEWL